ncbi:hypothetical protein MA16_Dca028168 [Dendrobium catenatum]|uniref:Uncharacterized protein n=1 Tax=Dendrobium catenatum TaxID=906689 RepID=A0A2I0VD56_9ASPA|nr:hypothetical protein MA16_Dca028168 [Dendrobium catenatum]
MMIAVFWNLDAVLLDAGRCFFLEPGCCFKIMRLLQLFLMLASWVFNTLKPHYCFSDVKKVQWQNYFGRSYNFDRTMMNADYSAAPRTVYWATRGHAQLRPKRLLTLRESEHFSESLASRPFYFLAFVITVMYFPFFRIQNLFFV